MKKNLLGLKGSLFILVFSILMIFSSHFTIITSADTPEENSPWVYPRSDTDPTPCRSEPYTVPIHGGPNTIQLVLWNHHNVQWFYGGKFIVAIKSGFNLFTIISISINGNPLTPEKYDDTGSRNPGADEGIYDGNGLPDDDIFPCPWKQYAVGQDLSPWENHKGWQGTTDDSGVPITIEINIPYPNSAEDVELYFLAFGYRDQDLSPNKAVHSPYGRSTKTYPIEPFVIPELPMGTLMAIIAPIAAIAVYAKKKKAI